MTHKREIDRMAAMLSRLGGRGCQVGENRALPGTNGLEVDPEPDPDSDLDKNELVKSKSLSVSKSII